MDLGARPNLLDSDTHDEHYDSAKGPKPEDIFFVPNNLLACLYEIAPKIKESGAWWALTGDLSDSMRGVHLHATEVEILTDEAGLEKISNALSSYNPSPTQVKERRLERDAELGLGFDKYPILEKSTSTEFTWKGVKVIVKGNCQMKVGDWEWGDPLIFEPDAVNLRGVFIPLMPLGLKSEFYITLGWLDKARLVSDAVSRAQSRLHEPPPKPKQQSSGEKSKSED